MIIYDLFSGTGSATKAFRDAGHRVISVEIDPQFPADERDLLLLTAGDLINKYGRPDFVWASPPCQTFSVASIGTHWKNNKPSEAALKALGLVEKTLSLINELNPRLGYLIENPRGLLRKQEIMTKLKRFTVTYCAYGENRMKPTDLFGTLENWQPRKACNNGDECHESAPRGSRTGTQGIKGAKDRGRIPYELSQEIMEIVIHNRSTPVETRR